MPDLVTERLRLRPWRAGDRDPFARLNADPAVMEHFPAPLDRAASDAFADRVDAHISEHGWGLWAVERRLDGVFLGFTGLWRATFEAHFTPAVEVGWRLDRAHWGNGYAPEAASAAVADGFDRLGFVEIVSFTSTTNVNSQRVMQKIGMTRDPADDFDHPTLPSGHPLERHVLYRIHPAQLSTPPPPGSVSRH